MANGIPTSKRVQQIVDAEYATDTPIEVGEMVIYHGSIAEYHGVRFVVVKFNKGWEGSLALAFPDLIEDPQNPGDNIACWNVRPKSVTPVNKIDGHPV